MASSRIAEKFGVSQMNIAKKIFAAGSSSLVAAASLVGFAAVAHAAVHAAGTNVLSNGTVYEVGTDGLKHPYTSAGAFLSYGFNSWAGVVAASPEDLALQTGAFIPPMDGSLINDMGTVYLITGGQREGFTSAANFLGLGYSFSTVLAGDTSFMTSGPVISSPDIAHPAGTLVNNAGTVELVTATGTQGIPSLAVFNSWGYSFSDVVPANSYDKALPMSAGIMPAYQMGCLSPLNCGSNATPPGQPGQPVPPTGNVNVTLSTDTPASNPTIVAGQSSADIGNFTFNGVGTVTSLSFTRLGVSNNSAIDNVYLYEGGARLTYGSSVTQNNTVSFSNAAGLFTVNGPTEIMVKADIDSNTTSNIAAGQTIGFQLTSGFTGSTAVAGTPVSSNLSTVAIATNLAKVTVGTGSSAPYGVTPTSGATVNAGTTNFVLWSAPISVANHAVALAGASFQYLGSAPASAFANFSLYLDGAKVATSSGINTSNYVVFTPTTPVAVNTGSHTLEVHADIIGGSNRNAQLTLQNGSDLVVTDTNYNVNVTPINSQSPTSGYFSPVPAASVTINTGTLSITQDPAFNTTTNIPAGATGQVIGSFQLQSYGENVQINSLSIQPTIGLTVTGTTPTGNPTVSGGCTAGTNCSVNNVSLFLNGSQVGNSQNWSGTGSLNFNFGSSFIVPAGAPVIFQVKADLQNTSGSSYTAGQIDATLLAGSSNVQGRTSLNTTSTPQVTGQVLTIGGSSGVVSVNTALSNSTILSNSTAQRIGSFIVQAGSAEGLRLNSASITFPSSVAGANTLTSGGTVFTYLNNLKIVVSNCSGSTYTASPVNPSSTNNFSLSCQVAANGTATIDVYADIGNSTGYVSPVLTLVGQGQSSNTSFLPAAVTGQDMQVTTGSVTAPSVGASSAVSALVASAVQPTQGPATTAAFNFTSSVGTATISELWVNVYGKAVTAATSYDSSVTAPVTQITVSGPGANGTTSTGTAPVVYTAVTSGNQYAVAHITGLNIQIPVGNAGQDVAITPTFNFVGTNGLTTGTGVNFGVIEYKYQTGTTTTDSGNIANGSVVHSRTMDLVASYPVVANSNGIVGVASGATMGAGMQVLQLTITANSTGPVRIGQIGVTANWSGTLTNANSGDTVKIWNVSNPSTILNGASGQSLVLGSSTTVSAGQVAIIFSTPEVIAAGTSKTYTISVDTSGLTTTGNSFRLDATNTGATIAAPATAVANTWAWNDATVANQGTGSETFLNGYLVQNLPITGPTFTR